MKSNSFFLAASVAVAASAISADALATPYWSVWVSEEHGGPRSTCTGSAMAARGFGSTGSSSDNVHLYCDSLPPGVVIDGRDFYWSKYFSEEPGEIETHYSLGWHPYEGDNYYVCNPTGHSGVVTGIRCSGSRCDNISIECAVPTRFVDGKKYYVGAYNCEWSGWLSDENGDFIWDYGSYITGVECAGRFCDNMRFYMCSFDANALIDPNIPRL